jgi:dihydroorotase
MKNLLILNTRIVNEGAISESDLLVKGNRIEKIGKDLGGMDADIVIDGRGNYLLPGVIDDQVHFREPGLTHKADIYSEAKAAVAGGVTSFMEMPNTKPPTLTQKELDNKYKLASEKSLANYSFYMGASNDNLDEVLKTDPKTVCGIKVFMGSSTGNMLVDDEKTLERIFRDAPMLVATHCEDEATIRRNMEQYREKYGTDVPMQFHPLIRSEEACFLSSEFAVNLAKKHGTKLHVLHISTAKETALFSNELPLAQKKITAEACIHHLWFDDRDYSSKGAAIKWNPAVKSARDKDEIFRALLDGRIDVVATDHAPHLMEEKNNPYFDSPSGGPLIQHSLNAMLEFHLDKKISLPQVVEKMCHNPAILFQVHERGFIREGYFADLVLADLNNPWIVEKDNILYKCGWSPFEGQTFRSAVTHTIVSGHLAYQNGAFDESVKGKRLTFER